MADRHDAEDDPLAEDRFAYRQTGVAAYPYVEDRYGVDRFLVARCEEDRCVYRRTDAAADLYAADRYAAVRCAYRRIAAVACPFLVRGRCALDDPFVQTAADPFAAVRPGEAAGRFAEGHRLSAHDR